MPQVIRNTVIMDPFDYLERYRVVVCKKCKFACVANEVTTHLRTRHKDITPTERSRISADILQIPHILRVQAELAHFQFPLPVTNPLPFLQTPRTDGLMCRRCPYIACQLQKIQAHCREKHQWRNTVCRGRLKSNDRKHPISELPWRENVLCQRFFPSRAASGWFEVGRKLALWKGSSNSSATSHRGLILKANPEARAHLEEVITRHEKQFDAESQPRVYSVGEGSDSLTSITPWLERTQWLATYKNVRRDLLGPMTVLPTRRGVSSRWADLVIGQGFRAGEADICSPKQDEAKLACMVKAVDLMLDRCETIALHTNRFLRCSFLRSRFQTHQPRAFSVMMEKSTRYRYRQSWKRFMLFVFRAYLMLESTRRRLQIELDKELRVQLRSLWEHRMWDTLDATRGEWPRPSSKEYQKVAAVTEWIEEDADETHLADSDESDDSDTSSQCELSDIDDTLEGLEEDYKYRQSDQKHDGRHDFAESSNIEFLELLFRLSCSLCMQRFTAGRPETTIIVYFSGIPGFTSSHQRFKLAREFCPSLLGLIYVQRLIFLEYAIPLHPYQSFELQQRPIADQLTRLQAICERYTVMGAESALTELVSLRNFGFVIGRSEAPAFILHWSEDRETVTCGDKLALTMDGFRGLINYFISQAEELCSKLLYGLQVDIDINKLKDDISNKTPGHSFVRHPENKLEEAWKILLGRICTTNYLTLSALSRNGQWSWNAMQRYLGECNNLENMLMGGLFTGCGQCPRSRELQYLQCENSALQRRSLFV